MHPLFLQLGSDQLAVRDDASDRIIGLGATVANELADYCKRVEDPSLRARCIFTLSGLRLRQESAIVASGARRFSIEFTGSLADALDLLRELTGARVDKGELPPETHLRWEIHDACLLQALDALCVAAGCDWERNAGGQFALLAKRPAARPHYYQDTLRLAVTSISQESRNDFVSRHIQLMLRIEALHDFLLPLSPPSLRLVSLIDGAGNDWPMSVTTQEGSRPLSLFTLSVEPEMLIPKIATLKGRIYACFAASHQTVELNELTVGTRCTAGNVEIWIEKITKHGFTLGTHCTQIPQDAPPEVVQNLVSWAALGIDSTGREALAAMSHQKLVESTVDGSPRRTQLLHLDFGVARNMQPTTVRLRIASELLVKRTPFHFHDILT